MRLNDSSPYCYIYDGIGNVLSIKGSDCDTLGILNHFRDKGYYDTEIGLFWYNSIYYNPEWGR